MFCEIVCQVVGASAPVYEEVAFSHTVFDPVKSHIHSFGTALRDGGVGDAGGASIVGLQGGGQLRMAHLCQGGAEHNAVFGVKEEGSEFGFGGG